MYACATRVRTLLVDFIHPVGSGAFPCPTPLAVVGNAAAWLATAAAAAVAVENYETKKVRGERYIEQ